MAGQTLEIRRRFDTTRGRLWRSLTDPQLVASWWGPETFSTTIDTWDVRFGGRYKARMTSSEGNALRVEGHFNQVDDGKALGFTWLADSDAGHPSRVLILIAGNGPVTEMLLRHMDLPDKDAVETYEWAWTGALDGLVQVVKP